MRKQPRHGIAFIYIIQAIYFHFNYFSHALLYVMRRTGNCLYFVHIIHFLQLLFSKSAELLIRYKYPAQ